MVVALLGMLFVVGVAFLQTVTFDAQRITVEVQTRQELAGIDAIEAHIFEALNAGWLTPEGTPYRTPGPELLECAQPTPGNPLVCADVNGNGTLDEAEYRVALPTYGELPYLHGLMAPLEPHLAFYQYNSNYETRAVLPYPGDIGAALRGNPALVRDYFEQVYPPAVPVRIDLKALPEFAVDADGDGVPEGREFDLTAPDSPIVLPSDAREVLRAQVNPADLNSNGPFLSVRAVPHGGMVDINWSHAALVYAVFPELAGTLDARGPLRTQWEAPDGPGRPYNAYRPETAEAMLRHRGGLPPRRLNESSLEREFASALLGRHPWKPGETAKSPFAEHRWWFHDLTEAGEDPEFPFWASIMAAPILDNATSTDLSRYDRRHIVTTYSTDNLLLRDGTYTDNTKPNYGRGWIEVRLDDVDYVEDPTSDPSDFGHWAGKWVLDDYPQVIDAGGTYGPLPLGDPRKGRLQISLPSLEVSLLDDPDPDPVNNGVNSLRARLDSTAPPLVKARATMFIRTIQEGFLLMLRDATGDGIPKDQKPRVAASLTANLIDFADADDIPTQVDAIDTNGAFAGYAVYGLERQPFITEVYNRAVYGPDTGEGNGDVLAAQSFSAVELYNPYDGSLDLAAFSLQVDANSPVPLSGTINPMGYRMFVTNMPTTDPPVGAGVLAGMSALTPSSQVNLTRPGSGGDMVILERFEVQTWQVSFPNLSSPGPADRTAEESLERAMWRVETAVPSAYWTAVVPVAQARTDSGHSLGVKNSWQGQDEPSKQLIRPVQVDFANKGSMWQSFPTTGTLLLLMRHANSEVGSGAGPFNARLAEASGGYAAGQEWKAEQYQIDNGRMPVFDTAGNHRRVQVLTDPEVVERLPMGYAYLPWGQYVFDYFTALPLSNSFTVVDADKNTLPEVDLDGARVYGRINLNAAPWTVLAGLPVIKKVTVPASYQAVLQQFTYRLIVAQSGTHVSTDNLELPIGERLAKAIEAYRDARKIPAPDTPLGTGDFSGRAPHAWDPDPAVPEEKFPPDESGSGGTDHAVGFGELRKGSGFLTVGELANVRHWDVRPDPADVYQQNEPDVNGDEYTPWRFDGGVVGRKYDPTRPNPYPGYPVDFAREEYPAEDYVQAVGLLVILEDWVTTRSNVWTIYGTLRGDRVALAKRVQKANSGMEWPQALKVATDLVNQRAIRFQETVDRLPSFLKPGTPPRRIGERQVGPYNDTRSD